MYAPIGAVTVIVPVLIAQVGCVSVVEAAAGAPGGLFNTALAVAVHPVPSFTVTV